MASFSYKIQFGDVYTAPDPRGYFREHAQYDYQIPQNALPWILQRTPAGSTPRVLDLCCSYGFNSMLLNHTVSWWELVARAARQEREELSSEDVLAQDTAYFAELRRRRAHVTGLDISAEAIDYGQQVGLLDAGWAENLEEHDPSPELVEGIRGTELLTCTGGTSYISDATFRRILSSLDRPEALQAEIFALRQTDMEAVQEAFAEFGLNLVRAPGVQLRQRRFATEEEANQAIAAVEAKGLTPEGLEATGWYFTELYTTSPTS